MRRKSWKAVAEILAHRVRNYAYDHGHPTPVDGCPFCQDVAAYEVYLERRRQDIAPKR